MNYLLKGGKKKESPGVNKKTISEAVEQWTVKMNHLVLPLNFPSTLRTQRGPSSFSLVLTLVISFFSVF